MVISAWSSFPRHAYQICSGCSWIWTTCGAGGQDHCGGGLQLSLANGSNVLALGTVPAERTPVCAVAVERVESRPEGVMSPHGETFLERKIGTSPLMRPYDDGREFHR